MELEGGAIAITTAGGSSSSPPPAPHKKARKPLGEVHAPIARSQQQQQQQDDEEVLLLACREAAAASTPLGLTATAASAAAGPASGTTTAPGTLDSSTGSSTGLPAGVVDIDDPCDAAASSASAGACAAAAFAAATAAGALGPAYSKEYHTYLKEREACARDAPRADYLQGMQGGRLTQDMRALLVDWLVTVAGECELMPSTLYHTVALVDRALSAFACPKDRLQCLGCACLLIASKFEETLPPTPREIRYAAADSFSAQELVEMEMHVVGALGFRVAAVTPYHFLPRFALAAGSRARETALVHYLSELTLLHYEFLAFPPSLRAAAALFLARATLAATQPDPHRRALEAAHVWTPTIAHYTGYAVGDLAACVRLLRRAHQASEWSAYEALRIKHSASATLHVAEQVPCLQEAQVEAALAPATVAQ